ncbi:Uncharacterised protein [Bordetella pertussis]|nr:Uncharacterised protein [Bordetella pertussis]CPN18963.1 Uncharacterised protein [Bordetella pertussis]CPQ95184.1 Uncharacterised protein [Bordetella pertussis]
MTEASAGQAAPLTLVSVSVNAEPGGAPPGAAGATLMTPWAPAPCPPRPCATVADAPSPRTDTTLESRSACASDAVPMPV